MFRFTVFIVLFNLLHMKAVTGSDDNYVFHLRRTGFVDTEVLRMLPGVDREVESLCRKMEVNCRFTRAVEEFEYLLRTAPGCVTPRDWQTLQDAISGFQIAREECVNKAVCKGELAQAVVETVTSISNIDTAAYQKVDACGTDYDCKYNAYNNTHNDIFSLYLSSRPQLRMLADRGVASADCAGAIVKCMVARNEAALRSMYEGAARLRECQEGAGEFSSTYPSRPNRVSEDLE